MTGYPIIVRHRFSLFRPASWQSLLIRILDKCWANHCGVLFQLKGQLCVVEARGAGVFISTWENWVKHRPKKDWIIGMPRVPIPHNLERVIVQSFGEPYDKESLYIWHPYRLLTGAWKGGIHATGNVTCSELVGLYWKTYFPRWYKLTTGDIVKSKIFIFDFKRVNKVNLTN